MHPAQTAPLNALSLKIMGVIYFFMSKHYAAILWLRTKRKSASKTYTPSDPRAFYSSSAQFTFISSTSKYAQPHWLIQDAAYFVFIESALWFRVWASWFMIFNHAIHNSQFNTSKTQLPTFCSAHHVKPFWIKSEINQPSASVFPTGRHLD